MCSHAYLWLLYVYISVCVCVHMCECVHVCGCAYTCAVCAGGCMCVCMHVCSCMYVLVCVCVCVCVHVCAICHSHSSFDSGKLHHRGPGHAIPVHGTGHTPTLLSTHISHTFTGKETVPLCCQHTFHIPLQARKQSAPPNSPVTIRRKHFATWGNIHMRGNFRANWRMPCTHTHIDVDLHEHMWTCIAVESQPYPDRIFRWSKCVTKDHPDKRPPQWKTSPL